MTTTTQQLPSNPARDFANIILEDTNGGLELIEILHDIAQGNDEDATENDRITASTILLDRGLGKCPKQSPATNPAPDTDSKPGAKEPKADNTPDSPRLVTQIDQSLHDSLGPPPSTHTPARHSREKLALVPRHGGGNPESYDVSFSPEPENPDPLDPFSIQTTIQQHILTITNGGRTLFAALAEIARAHDAPEPRRKKKTSHRTRATRILIDRLAGTDLMPVHNAICPDCRRKWSAQPGSHDRTEHSEAGASPAQEEPVDKEVLADAVAKLKQLEKEHNLDPNRPITKHDYSNCWPPDDFDFTPYLQEADEFRAELALKIERRKQWPAIEERRRKKLAQIYPSHSDDSEDDEPPDT